MAALVIVALLLACLGTGRVILLPGGASTNPRTDGIAGLTGLALLTGLAGWLVLAGVYSAAAGWVLLALGGGALAVDLFRTRASPSATQHASGGIPVNALAIGLLSLTLVVGRVLGEFALPVVSVNDDLPVYWHFPRLLLESGGFIEPFNIRRLVTLGASPFLQSFLWKDLGIAAPGIADTLLGQLVIWAAARTVPTALSTQPQPAWRGEAFALATLLASLALTRANAMPTLLPMGGALVLMLLTRRVTETDTPSNGIRAAIAWGLVAAWLIGLRISNAPFPTVLWLVGALVAALRKDRQQGLRLAVAALVTLVGLLPWSLALWRSSGTLLFPLMHGNYHAENSPPAPPDFAAILDFAGACLWSNHVWIIVAIGGLAALRPAVRLLSIQVSAALLLLVTVTAVMANMGQAVDSLSIHRYSAPFLVAGLVTFAGSILVTEAGATLGRVRPLLLGVGLALWLLIPVALRLSLEEPFRITNFGLILRSAALAMDAAADARDSGLKVREWPGRATYEAAQASLPADARLVSATNMPFFFRFDTQTIHTLDIAGLVSPPPGMPSFEGPERIAAYFLRLGYTHLAFTPPQAATGLAATGLYSPDQWMGLNEHGTLQERNWARHVLAFLQNEALLERSYAVAYQSLDLVVIDLRRPK